MTDNTTAAPPARSREQRKQDVMARLEGDEDVWVATASGAGEPLLAPLSFVWHEGALLMCTRRTNRTARNLTPRGRVRLSLGHTRDVVLLDGDAEAVEGHALDPAAADAFAGKLNWDPRAGNAWLYLRVTIRSVRAWREENELADRLLMREGTWLI
ncbi:pyridoxamine 5'-phosphate oxidase family protein [Streptomyces sp. MUM 203J]|uniref:pyridoxamine 5'-phosphate oxidase family protein n=1 Tax=Streptomyces sp. MUM 203J TaxID=2791990 RepID=UPI001F04B191|nr:pyridoxamine 5'-phosphate oxidase family protein [Streptomyces sp. MUM 203J]MCH0541949.1 pyridoxamine 5'-phosphate oxidase family protein [Streptomyces sp. MUM 203J]